MSVIGRKEMFTMDSERQSSWGWPIAAAVFLGGAGGGAFLISFVMDVLGKYGPLARTGAIAGPVLVLICAAFLFIDLNSKAGFYRLFVNLRSSWMSRGTWFITAFVILGLIYSVPSFWITWGVDTTPGLVIGAAAAILAFLVTLYTGVLFGVLKRIPLWSTPALPLLYIFSALSTGMAVMVLIAAFLAASLGEAFAASVPAEIIFIVMEIIILWVYIEIVRKVSVAGAESVRLLLSPLFITAVIVAGLIVPLGLLAYTQAGGYTFVAPVVSSILVLIGGYILRYGILKAGIYPPWYIS